MRINILNHLVCPKCRGRFLFLISKKTKERIIEGKLECKKCGKKFYVKDGIACFTSYSNKHNVSKDKLRKVTLKQEIPKRWMRLFSKAELAVLKKEWGFFTFCD